MEISFETSALSINRGIPYYYQSIKEKGSFSLN